MAVVTARIDDGRSFGLQSGVMLSIDCHEGPVYVYFAGALRFVVHAVTEIIVTSISIRLFIYGKNH